MSPRWLVLASDGWCSVHRLQWASIEGEYAEMLAFAEALTSRRDYSAKRCAVTWDYDGEARHGHERALVSSPRNSISPTSLTPVEAGRLADEIRAEIGSVTVPEPAESPFADLDPVDRLTAELDLLIYGTAVVEREPDGTFRVLDPLAVRLRGDLLSVPERDAE